MNTQDELIHDLTDMICKHVLLKNNPDAAALVKRARGETEPRLGIVDNAQYIESIRQANSHQMIG